MLLTIMILMEYLTTETKNDVLNRVNQRSQTVNQIWSNDCHPLVGKNKLS